MKFCKDCKFVSKGCLEYAKCSCPKAYNMTDLVTGKKERFIKFCEHLRDDSYSYLPSNVAKGQGVCGSEGKWFEQKESRLTMLENWLKAL